MVVINVQWTSLSTHNYIYIKFHYGTKAQKQVNHEQIKCIFACLTQLNYWNTINQPYPHLLVSTFALTATHCYFFTGILWIVYIPKYTPFTLHKRLWQTFFFKTSSTIINWFSLLVSPLFFVDRPLVKLDKWTSDIKVYLIWDFMYFFPSSRFSTFV